MVSEWLALVSRVVACYLNANKGVFANRIRISVEFGVEMAGLSVSGKP